ncbi:unnamed protein product [Allacma fusca]|uniref:Uncharacterized protein n=1 Tax=Allacma fusca TaxID=39272 RepID=A0A8J2PCA7_9HEXA|nr:unnamed protein product [Allacma fusca]
MGEIRENVPIRSSLTRSIFRLSKVVQIVRIARLWPIIIIIWESLSRLRAVVVLRRLAMNTAQRKIKMKIFMTCNRVDITIIKARSRFLKGFCKECSSWKALQTRHGNVSVQRSGIHLTTPQSHLSPFLKPANKRTIYH